MDFPINDPTPPIPTGVDFLTLPDLAERCGARAHAVRDWFLRHSGAMKMQIYKARRGTGPVALAWLTEDGERLLKLRADMGLPVVEGRVAA